MFKYTHVRISLCTLLCGLTAIVAGCAESTPQLATEAVAGDTLINTICPIMGGEATSDVKVDWNGKMVGFCCPPCIEEWAELTDQEREAKLATAKARPHGDHDHH